MHIKEQTNRISRFLDDELDFQRPLGYVDGVDLYQFVDSDPIGGDDPTGFATYKSGFAISRGEQKDVDGNIIGEDIEEGGTGGKSSSPFDIGNHTITIRTPDGELVHDIVGLDKQSDKYVQKKVLKYNDTVKPGDYFAIDLSGKNGESCKDCKLIVTLSCTIADAAGHQLKGTVNTADGPNALGTRIVDHLKGADKYFCSPGTTSIAPMIEGADGSSYYDAPNAAIGFCLGLNQKNTKFTATYSFHVFLYCGGKLQGNGQHVEFTATQNIGIGDILPTPESLKLTLDTPKLEEKLSDEDAKLLN